MNGLLLTLILTILSIAAFASEKLSPNVSSICYQEYRDMGDSKERASMKCKNVSNDCYEDTRRFESMNKDESIIRCNNVANTCYTDITRVHSTKTSAQICLDVNNSCYEENRADGLNSQQSRDECRPTT